MEGWFATNNGRKEFRITNEEPRQVTPITTNIGATKNICGTTKMKSMEEMAPIKPNERRSFLRYVPGTC